MPNYEDEDATGDIIKWSLGCANLQQITGGDEDICEKTSLFDKTVDTCVCNGELCNGNDLQTYFYENQEEEEETDGATGVVALPLMIAASAVVAQRMI